MSDDSAGLTASNRTGIEPFVVLGSQSAGRLAVLGALLPAQRIRVMPPENGEEPGFEGLADIAAIEARIALIARLKHVDVARQVARLSVEERSVCGGILTADTVIVGTRSDGQSVVCGKPPATPGLAEAVVRDWFVNLYAGRWHVAKTALCFSMPGANPIEQLVTTRVLFHPESAELVDWYLSTGEPFGKAGGYAIQGGGSLFVQGIDGSVSNVAGLPLWETRNLLRSILP
ncbi:MAG: Maf family protein [Planctomycetaceae bacterium]